MYSFIVEVKIKKGLSAETIIKNFNQSYDDIGEMTEDEAKEFAKIDTHNHLKSLDDYKLYGKNWNIINVYSN